MSQRNYGKPFEYDIALEESGEAELQETQGTASKKRQYDRAKAEDVRLKAME